jgi:phosphoribosylanthranilate isomerase
MARVKICGVNSAEAFDAAADAGADWIGFVFFAASPRYVSPAQAAALSARRLGGPARVGLFVDPTDEDVMAALAAMHLDVLQLYAPPARVAAIGARFDRPVWRAVGVSSAGDLPAEAAPAAALLIEPRAPRDASRPGGNGQAMEWSMLRGWSPDYDWILAGGLNPVNVAQAISISGAKAVDVSSGVETAPGVKSPALIFTFIQAAKGWGGCAIPPRPPVDYWASD